MVGTAGITDQTGTAALPALFVCPDAELFETSNASKQIHGEDHDTCCRHTCARAGRTV